MGLGLTWADANLEHQQKEQSYVRFINLSPKIHQIFPGIEPKGIGAPYSDAYL